MDAELRTSHAPFRDPRYAPRQLEVVKRGGGEVILSHPGDFDRRFTTTTAALAHWAAVAPERVWLAERSGDGWRTLSYAEAWQRISALAAGLRDLGVVGERPLLILARNNIDHALIAYAAMGQGMPVAPVSPQYGMAGANLARLTHACRSLNPAAVYAEDAAVFAEGLGAEALAGLPVIVGANPRPGDVALDRLYEAGSAGPTAHGDQHAKYLLTSGSTGAQKAVICLHRTMSINAAQITACFTDAEEPPVLVHSAPWSHSLGGNAILHYVAHRGGTLYIDAGQPTAARFGETIRNLREISPTYMNMVPAAWMLFAEALERDDELARTFFSRVRLLQYGGAALSQAYGDRIQAVAVRTVGERISFGSGYGATETGPTASNVHWPNARMGLMGLPLPGTSVRLLPEHGKLEFRVKGPQISPGYLNQPELSAAAFDDEGFYRLGDAARFADPADPRAGLVFDGRISENFKLTSGTFVIVSDLRLGVLGDIGGAVTDAVVCGENQDRIGVLFYPNPTLDPAEVGDAVRKGVAAFNARAQGAGGRIARALLLPDGPDAGAGEITDKGYISQSLARARRADAVERLFADPPAPDVMVFA